MTTMGIWSLLLSAKNAQATMRKTAAVVQQIRSTIQNLSAAELQDLRRRAESGDCLAQYDLAEKYYTGAGMPQDFAEAVRWYEMSAKSGHVKSQVTLSMLYASGRGVARDFVQALIWIDQAAAARDATAVRFRAKLLTKMSREEIAAARGLC